jgi:hypothetical protein
MQYSKIKRKEYFIFVDATNYITWLGQRSLTFVCSLFYFAVSI